MQSIPPLLRDIYPSGFEELFVGCGSEERVRQGFEEEFEQGGYGVDILVEVCWVAEIEVCGERGASCFLLSAVVGVVACVVECGF